jgi:hypothetical protein
LSMQIHMQSLLEFVYYERSDTLASICQAQVMNLVVLVRVYQDKLASQ